MASVISRLTKPVVNASEAWQQLNGVVLLHKPGGINMVQLRQCLKVKLSIDLMKLKARPPEPYVDIEGNTAESLHVNIRPSYADNELVVGPRYQTEDMRVHLANRLDTDASGLVVAGINKGTQMAFKLKLAAATQLYRVKGTLGLATDNFFKTGKIVEKSKYTHVKHDVMDKICASIQSTHQKKMFEHCGVDIQSQAAYEIALKGLIRPINQNIPIIYTIKCIHFNPPDFSLEIVCMRESGSYLKQLVHDIGIRLNTNAVCTHISCLRYAMFDLRHALVAHEWNVRSVIRAMKSCNYQIVKNKFLLDGKDIELRKPNLYPK